MKSTNMLERLNQEIKRRTHVVRIFPNTESCCCFRSASEIAGRGEFHVDYSHSIWLLSTGSMLITEGDR
jgi:hypothetical protein